MKHRLSAEDRAALLRQHLDDGVPLARISGEAGIPLRTLQRWSAGFRAGGSVAALGRRPRSDRGSHSLPPEIVGAIEGLALRRPAPTIAFIHRRIGDVALDRGLPAPGYSTVRAVVVAIDPGLRTIALEGDTAYRDRFELVYRRTARRANEQWQCDHTELDIEIVDAAGARARPWLTVVLDDYSRAVAGYTVFTGAPNALQTALALHQAVQRKKHPAWPVMGLPDLLYSDHGADFTSTHLDRVCLDTHIRLIHSLPGVPQGRGKIERFYRTLTDGLLPHLPGFIPHGTRGTPVTAPTMTLEQLDTALERFIVDEYNQRTHSETGEIPTARWQAGGWIPRMPARPEDLDLLLLTVAHQRIVHRDGIHFNGLRYLDLTLSAFVGESITIRYDPRDMAEIRVWHQDTFLCRAIAPELAAGTITFKQLKAARSARRNELKQQLRTRLSLADALPADDRYAPPAPAKPAETGGQPADPKQHRLRTYAED
ncbi:Mu transposase C-terminal domain-containing protein [Arthrobacter sp. NicSoilB8]|uniref:Mu transposase C-terminal domain-containing protein n=1 Tax=Arthrobacter sp. NicSoilB8 TaxID=2830998 RepID=UPI001CC65FE1|nr:Mu transposase C-terminal domain-containing protein [Arthrobacter sp. NicSoilB8]BCW69143.1 transposase [Arthrobacter sp. NicSoilB8]